MSLRMAKIWQCDIFPDRVRLRDGQQVINEMPRQAEEALEDVLARLLSVRRQTLSWLPGVEFWLDNSLAHTLTVPWQQGIATPEELRCYALSLAQNVFPQLSGRPLVVDFEQLNFGQTSLVVVLEEAFWQTLIAAAHQQKLRFKGVVTPFQHLLRSQNQPLQACGIYAVAGVDASSFACRAEGQWQHVHRMALPDLSLQQQFALIKRLSGLKGAPCYCLDNLSWQVSELKDEAAVSFAGQPASAQAADAIAAQSTTAPPPLF